MKNLLYHKAAIPCAALFEAEGVGYTMALYRKASHLPSIQGITMEWYIFVNVQYAIRKSLTLLPRVLQGLGGAPKP